MIPELGHYALILALALAAAQCVLPLAGLATRRMRWMALAEPAAAGQFVFLALSFAALSYAFYANDFSVAYVANNSNTALPWYYRLSAVWGSHEGSLLLWVLMLAAWGVAVAAYSRSLPRDISSTVLAVMGAVSLGFLLFTLLTSNPFERTFPPASEGRDLNPLLQDPGLIIHPPMLYMGYVGFSVAFAFAITALLTGRVDSAWTRWTRPWTTAAWLFLTAGITLGSWWAYHELGWGGWWFWDPVENASFMPWLVGTALIHSLAVTEKRGIFQSWTVLLAITTFALSLLGTFLVRSGVLISVHAFATDPGRGIYILAFFAVVVGGSLLLYAWRAPTLNRPGEPVRPISREGLLLLNNIFLLVAAAAVLLGTLYPLVADAFGWGKISVGPPYFNAVFAPLMIPLVALVGLSFAINWKRANLKAVLERLWPVMAAAVLAGVLIPWATVAPDTVAAFAGAILGAWAIAAAVEELWRRSRGGRRWQWPRGVLGMSLAHTGLGVAVIGVSLVSALSVDRDVRLAPGEYAELSGYRFQFLGITQRQGPNYEAQVGKIELFRGGEQIAVLSPEKRHYHARGSVMTEAGIDTGVFRDVYVSMGEPMEAGAWSLRLYYRPFVRWIWAGGLLMVLGGTLAATDPRYRRLRRKAEAPGREGLEAAS